MPGFLQESMTIRVGKEIKEQYMKTLISKEDQNATLGAIAATGLSLMLAGLMKGEKFVELPEISSDNAFYAIKDHFYKVRQEKYHRLIKERDEAVKRVTDKIYNESAVAIQERLKSIT